MKRLDIRDSPVENKKGKAKATTLRSKSKNKFKLVEFKVEKMALAKRK